MGRFGGTGNTADTLEPSLFGDVSVFPKMESTFQRYTLPESGYIPYPLAMKAVREGYGDDPAHPTWEFARDVLVNLRDKLDVPPERAELVCLYSAVGTPLGLLHGIDAWIEFPGDPSFVVTLYAVREGETRAAGSKADVVVGQIPESGSHEYVSSVSEVTNRIVHVLAAQIRARESQ